MDRRIPGLHPYPERIPATPLGKTGDDKKGAAIFLASHARRDEYVEAVRLIPVDRRESWVKINSGVTH